MLKISYNLFHGCQPWRVIAMPLSGRVAEEMDVTIVKQVDYGIRFEDYSSHKAVLK
jgi:HrpA-like RNA helicase